MYFVRLLLCNILTIIIIICSVYTSYNIFYDYTTSAYYIVVKISGDRAMSPAQSEDSGLAPDRGTTYATISLPRESAQAMGIKFAGKNPN